MSIGQILVRSGLEVPQIFLDYLEPNWELLSASAYAGYLKKGRGLLWFDWLSQLPVKSCPTDVNVMYCTPHGANSRIPFPQGMNNDARRLIREYDPEGMIIIRYNDGTMTRTRTIALSASDSPLEAYNSMQGRLSEFELMLPRI